ncbi:PPOX class F420-dependent oxidoreductase [Tsukamurella sp. 8F]|uniref:PPOX class F420-dependent oxidoreductase n=1 Tax=unclassified Tsukamurella TaxID=2633480 RepID=UPI0023B8ABD8|nr:MULTISPECIES: PPOX class F420-dependent oxidoreductase [unclassified Tsukamurella]MDF0529387.1 PPOX class F420-dependent oxidoreductase [Tsukamurella sp. 8J]MDF0587106.1 PPOX class F420-dependent oxidoreductase [Tsukamurella sp. 8F]
MSDNLLDLFGATSESILITIKRDGRPQSSNVTHYWDAERRTALVSVTADRAKTRNIVRDPRVSLHVNAAEFYRGYAVGEGIGALTAVAQSPDDEAVAALIDYYRALRGEHPDWAEYAQAMIDQRRQLLRLRVDRVYGLAR